ncbi:MAG: cyclopropane-fatty-acyl-phospholipid synthase family protein [Acidimicrobiales bacterium]
MKRAKVLLGRWTPERTVVSRKVLTTLARRVQHGSLVISEHGQARTYGRSDASGISADLEVLDDAVWRRVVGGGGVGLGQSYFLGEWESTDLVALLRLLTLNLDRINRAPRLLAPLVHAIGRPFRNLGRPSKSQDRANIASHYDLGDEFFSLFLDPTMAYSCAVFSKASSTLVEASKEKFDRICRKLELGPDDHVVEIGTGWGGFAIHAAAGYGCRVTTTTISQKQFAYATRAVAEAGLSDRVTVLNVDYRDLEGQFSHLVSIEMIEAVDWRHYETYFATCSRLLKPDGRAAFQCIVIDDHEFERYKTRQDYIRRFIFPGGGLPSITAISNAVTKATDLRVTDLEDLGPHYVRTLHEWSDRLDARWSDALALGFDDQFLRMWRFYFAYCMAGFAERHVSVIQLVMARSKWRGDTTLRDA